MTKADFYRKTLIESIIKDGVQKNNRININLNGAKGQYTEIITLDEIKEVTDNFKTHKNVESFLNELVNDRLSTIMGSFSYKINESDLDLNNSSGKLVADYQIALESEWIKELRTKFKVDINQDVLAKVNALISN